MENQIVYPNTKERNGLRLFNIYNFATKNRTIIGGKIYYFMLTYFCELKMDYDNQLTQKDKSQLAYIEKKVFEELSRSGWSKNDINKNLYENFLGSYFGSIQNFASLNLNNLYLCQDLLFLLTKFGPLNDYGTKMQNYLENLVHHFIKKSQEPPAKDLININELGNSNTPDEPNDEDEKYDKNLEEEFEQLVNENIDDYENILEEKKENTTGTEEKKALNGGTSNIKENIIKLSPKDKADAVLQNPKIKVAGSAEYNDAKEKMISSLSSCSKDLEESDIASAKENIENVIIYLRNILSKN